MERHNRTSATALLVIMAAAACGSIQPLSSADAAPRLATDRAIVDFTAPGPLSPEDSVLALVPHPWPGRAMLLSIAGLATPFVLDAALDGDDDRIDLLLLAAGMTLGPSAGHFYAGQHRRAIGWALVRSLGFALVAASLDEDGEASEGGAPAAFSGAAILLGGSLLEIFVVPADVHRANRALAASRLQATFVPMRGGAQVRLSVALGEP